MQSKVCLGRHTVYTNRRSNSNRRLMPAWFRLAWNQVRIQFRAFFILQAINKGTPLFQTPSLNVCDEEYPNIMATTCFPVDAEPSYARRHPSRQKSPVDAPRMHPPSQSTWSTDMLHFVDWAFWVTLFNCAQFCLLCCQPEPFSESLKLPGSPSWPWGHVSKL